jgi:hypothetical protein
MTRQLSTVAECAKLIRQDLKKHYPLTKFSVRSENYSMGNSIRVAWEDGANTEEIRAKLNKYEGGKFDGMTDSYTYHSNPDNMPRTKYLFLDHSFSEERLQKAFNYFKTVFPEWENESLDSSSREVYGTNPRCFLRGYLEKGSAYRWIKHIADVEF